SGDAGAAGAGDGGGGVGAGCAVATAGSVNAATVAPVRAASPIDVDRPLRRGDDMSGSRMPKKLPCYWRDASVCS
ncbi:hypothetical protein WN67_32960, partial [Mycolicibacterium obuense]